MRKLAISLSCIAILFLSACTCTIEKRSIEQLEANLNRQKNDHQALMQKVNRPDAEKADWDKHYKATFDLINGLKKQTE